MKHIEEVGTVAGRAATVATIAEGSRWRCTNRFESPAAPDVASEAVFLQDQVVHR